MIEDRRQAVQLVRDMLAGHVDPVLGAAGFARRSNSIVYRRGIADGVQRIVFSCSFRPRYASDAAHIDMSAFITFPEVNRIVREELGVELLAARDFTVVTEAQTLAPLGQKLWLARKRADFTELGRFIADFLRDTMLPRLDELTTPEGLADIRDGDRAAKVYGLDIEWWIHAVAASVIAGRLDDAAALLADNYDARFPLHMKYAPADRRIRELRPLA